MNLSPQQRKVLDMLRGAGDRGVCGTEFLAAYVPTYSQRMGDLRRKGYTIRKGAMRGTSGYGVPQRHALRLQHRAYCWRSNTHPQRPDPPPPFHSVAVVPGRGTDVSESYKGGAGCNFCGKEGELFVLRTDMPDVIAVRCAAHSSDLRRHALLNAEGYWRVLLDTLDHKMAREL